MGKSGTPASVGRVNIAFCTMLASLCLCALPSRAAPTDAGASADTQAAGSGTAAATPASGQAAAPASSQNGTPSAAPAQAPQQQRLFNINAYDVDGNTILDELTIENAVYPYLGPNRTIADINGAKHALEEAYQSRGYQSVVVELPPQSVAGGVVKLHVVEAAIGRLRVVGSNYSLPSRIREQVPALAEGTVPNFNEAQQQLADANRQPDRMRVTPLLKPGKVPGTVDVDLNVTDKAPVHGSLEGNNDHSQDTTDYRLIGTLRYDNLWQLGHSISATYLVAPQNTKDGQVYAGSYLAPIWGSPWSVLAYGYDSNSSVTTLGGTNVLGKGYALGLRGILQLPSFGDFTQSLNFGFDYKHFDENLTLTTATSADNVEYWPLVASYALQHATTNSTSSVTASVTAGVRGIGSDAAAFNNKRAFAGTDFVHFNLDAEHTQALGADIVANIKFAGQVADQPLVASEEFSAGGFTSVRGYLQSEAVGDDGITGSFELRSPSIAPWFGSWMKEWRFYTFADAGNVWVLDTLPDQQSVFTLYSVGAGTRLNLLDHFLGDVAVAFPLRNGPATDAKRPYVQFSVKTQF